MLKLLDTDGAVMEEFEDGIAILAIHSDRSMTLVLQKLDDHEEVPMHTLLVGALAVFLRDRHNVELVLDAMPRKRKSTYKGN